jgi:23S rRNA-/tRNA-specific pseudouridylate synthase
VRVLFEDALWLCVDKPTATFTTPAAGQRAPSLVDAVRRLRPRATHHHPLSRLDADVTGAVLFALTAEAVALAEKARAEGRYARAYVGLVTPAPEPSAGAWTWAVARDPRDHRKRTAGPGEAPQPAETRYAVEARAGIIARVGFVPVTGRTHQIRVHCRAAGAPLLGDPAYGGARRVVLDDGSVVAAGRVMLHARRVQVPGSQRVIAAPWHADMQALWEACGGDGSDATEATPRTPRA